MSVPSFQTSRNSRSGGATPAHNPPALKLSPQLNTSLESAPVRIHKLFWRRNSAEASGQNTENRSIDRKIANAYEHTLLIGDGSRDIDAIMSRSLQMHSLERLWEKRNQTAVLITSAVITLAIAAVDRWTKPYVSLGFLYLFPLMLAAAFIPGWVNLLAGVGCAILAELFGSLGVSWTRLSLEALALAQSGLFVAELVRNRRMGLETQEKLRPWWKQAQPPS